MIDFIKKHCKSITIDINGKPYLTRYYILCNRLSFLGLYLHEFHASDGDRNLHNHPWTFAISYILKGYYIESRLGRNLQDVKRSTFNFIGGSCFHRIVEIKPGLHTLFFRGPRVKNWGFLRAENGTVVFDEYKYEGSNT